MSNPQANQGQPLGQIFTPNDYRIALSSFDVAVCEAYAVSQAQAGSMAAQNVAYAIMVYTRLCGHGVSMIRAAPYSRWVKSDFEDWNFSALASHARSILEGYLSFSYLIDPPINDAHLEARLYVMHLNESTRRMEFHMDLGSEQSRMYLYTAQQEEIRQKLLTNEYFISLPPRVQKFCLSGNCMMIESRDQLLDKLISENKLHFNAIFDIWSQYLHILPLSFYRIEPNGRGCGVENDADRNYMGHALQLSAELLTIATNEVVQIFPHINTVRQGINSTFSPGPRSNRPKPKSSIKPHPKEKSFPPSKQKMLSNAITDVWESKYKI